MTDDEQLDGWKRARLRPQARATLKANEDVYPVGSESRDWRPFDSIGGQGHVDEQIARGVYTLAEAQVLSFVVEQDGTLFARRDFLDLQNGPSAIDAMIERGLVEEWPILVANRWDREGTPTGGVPMLCVTLGPLGMDLAGVDIAEGEHDMARWQRRPEWDGKNGRRRLIQEDLPIVLPPTHKRYPQPLREIVGLAESRPVRLSKADKKRIQHEQQGRKAG